MYEMYNGYIPDPDMYEMYNWYITAPGMRVTPARMVLLLHAARDTTLDAKGHGALFLFFFLGLVRGRRRLHYLGRLEDGPRHFDLGEQLAPRRRGTALLGRGRRRWRRRALSLAGSDERYLHLFTGGFLHPHRSEGEKGPHEKDVEADGNHRVSGEIAADPLAVLVEHSMASAGLGRVETSRLPGVRASDG